MIRKTKALGLALVALFAMAAMASIASAEYFHSEVDHTTIHGTQLGEDVFTVNAGTVKCGEATYHGTTTEKTVKELTITPTYSECKAFGFVNATIDMNGCHYKFTPTGERRVHIICPEGKTIVVTAFNCEVTVPAQTPPGTVTYTTGGSGKTHDVTVKVNLTGIEYIQHSKSFPGCSSNGTVPRTDGTYTGEATVKGFDTEGNQVGITADTN